MPFAVPDGIIALMSPDCAELNVPISTGAEKLPEASLSCAVKKLELSNDPPAFETVKLTTMDCPAQKGEPLTVTSVIDAAIPSIPGTIIQNPANNRKSKTHMKFFKLISFKGLKIPPY